MSAGAEGSPAGTGYGRQTLPFAKDAIRSEILCHGLGAHAMFPATRTVLDIGGQDTKAIQVDESGIVTSFQMNDRCAAGCGRYLGYIADEMNMGLHELGPLAMKATKTIRINSTCTVFAGATSHVPSPPTTIITIVTAATRPSPLSATTAPRTRKGTVPRPKNRYRDTANAAMVPRTRAIAVAPSPALMLVTKALRTPAAW